MISVALVGYGYWGKIIRKYIDDNEKLVIKNIYNPNGDNDEIFTTDLDVVLNADIDWVILATPIDTHYQLAKKFLSKGINVFCEKPLTKNKDEVMELMKIAEENKCIIETNYIYLDSQSIELMKDKLYSIGDILSVNGEIAQYGNFYENDGVSEVVGCHLISVILYLFGYEYIDVVTKNAVLDINKNKNALVNYTIIKYPNYNVNLRFSLIDTTKKREVIIHGTKGILYFNMLDNVPLRIRIYKEDIADYYDEEFLFDEQNNLKRTMQRIVDLNDKIRESNIILSYNVSCILERILKNEI